MRRPKAVEYVCVCRRSMKRLSGLFPSGFLPCCYWLARRSHFCKEVAGTWTVSHRQAGETLLLLPQWLQRKAVKLCLSLWSEAWVQASASFVDTLYTYQRNKNVLEARGHDRHLFALGIPGNSQLVYILLHCTTWGKITELPLAL